MTGRRLQGQPDELVGFERSTIEVDDPDLVTSGGRARHAIVKWIGANDSRVTGAVLEITDEKGTRDVEFEGHSRNNYYRGGWRDGMVKVGDKITLNAAPTRDGSDGGYALGVIAADGTRF